MPNCDVNPGIGDGSVAPARVDDSTIHPGAWTTRSGESEREGRRAGCSPWAQVLARASKKQHFEEVRIMLEKMWYACRVTALLVGLGACGEDPTRRLRMSTTTLTRTAAIPRLFLAIQPCRRSQ